MRRASVRLGIDLGGTKTEIIALEKGGGIALRRRVETPRTYDGLLELLAELVAGAEAELGKRGSIGMAIPGTESAAGLIKNANTTYLIGKPFRHDLIKALGREVRLANDANCFALSEATDGAAAGAATVFGVIAGTGVGGGVVVDGKILNGAHGICGEWGHVPLPAPSMEEVTAAPACYCGKRGCVEVWCSGPALTRDFLNDPLRPPLAREPATGTSPFEKGEDPVWTAEKIAASDHPAAIAALDRWLDRFARALATVANILDPEVIVLGGGLSNIARLYEELPPLVEKYAFNLGAPPRIVKNMHGDSSGVRGAAWLWPE